MKKIVFLIMALVLIPVSLFASPFVVCDPQEGVAYYNVVEGAITTEITALNDGSLKMDVGTATVGTHSISVSACSMWECSSSVPFVYTRPAIGGPAGIKLSK